MLSILIVDNNDSFTYNLVEMLRQTKLCAVEVCLLENVCELSINNYDGVILSPGPGLPKEKTGLSDFIAKVEGVKPLLGVCLGHQAIAEYFGAQIFQLQTIIHGEASIIQCDDLHNIFTGLPKKIEVGRYHSWAVDAESLPTNAQITSATSSGVVMSVKYKGANVSSVQFHPESILTKEGGYILKNWLTYCVAKK